MRSGGFLHPRINRYSQTEGIGKIVWNDKPTPKLYYRTARGEVWMKQKEIKGAILVRQPHLLNQLINSFGLVSCLSIASHAAKLNNLNPLFCGPDDFYIPASKQVDFFQGRSLACACGAIQPSVAVPDPRPDRALSVGSTEYIVRLREA